MSKRQEPAGPRATRPRCPKGALCPCSTVGWPAASIKLRFVAILRKSWR